MRLKAVRRTRNWLARSQRGVCYETAKNYLYCESNARSRTVEALLEAVEREERNAGRRMKRAGCDASYGRRKRIVTWEWWLFWACALWLFSIAVYKLVTKINSRQKRDPREVD